MGALWKVRRNLKNTHGVEAGGAVADSLFVGWMNAFTIGRIKSVIEYQWLILDDNDGILSNGTPNLTDINSAFQEQGFPGFSVPPIRVVCN